MNLPIIDVARPDTVELLPLDQYDLVIVSLSGGKDSVACLLAMLDMGVYRLQAWHQHIDGLENEGAEGLMDWPCTSDYCRKLCAALGVRLLFQWRVGGFEREMNRENALTAPVRFERQDGTIGEAGGKRGKRSTRKKFPQVSANLSVRWCSPYLKIDVMSIALSNDPALRGKRILIITGERRQESSARAKYAERELHRTNSGKRTTHQWRAIIDWTEAEVWAKLAEHNINPHVAYHLGWGRLSCSACIFGLADQWASVRDLFPSQFNRIAAYETQFGCTINRKYSVVEQADKGTPYPQLADNRLVGQARSMPYTEPILLPEGTWTMPAGAFQHCGGPS